MSAAHERNGYKLLAQPFIRKMSNTLLLGNENKKKGRENLRGSCKKKNTTKQNKSNSDKRNNKVIHEALLVT